MIKLVFVSFFLLIGHLLFSQSDSTFVYKYEYDAAGNRISRKLIIEEIPTPIAFVPEASYSNDDSVKVFKRNFTDYLSIKEKIDSTNEGVTKKNPSQIKVFPNPTTGLLQVYVNGEYNLKIGTSEGKIIKSMSSNINTTIDMTSHQPGIYYIIVTPKTGNTQTWKVSKI